jgi:hypothetical protein
VLERPILPDYPQEQAPSGTCMRFFIIFFPSMFVFTSEKMTSYPRPRFVKPPLLLPYYYLLPCQYVMLNFLFFFCFVPSFVEPVLLECMFYGLLFVFFFVCFTSKCCITYHFFFYRFLFCSLFFSPPICLLAVGRSEPVPSVVIRVIVFVLCCGSVVGAHMAEYGGL